jgi:hypothetical protein
LQLARVTITRFSGKTYLSQQDHRLLDSEGAAGQMVIIASTKHNPLSIVLISVALLLIMILLFTKDEFVFTHVAGGAATGPSSPINPKCSE